MKSSLANISVAIRILIRFLLLLIIFSQKSSSSKAGFLEALFGLRVLGDPIVRRVLTAFGSGVANPWIGMMLTLQMVIFAIHNLSDRFFLLGKDLLSSPFLILVLLCFAGILRRAFVLLRCYVGNAKLVDLSREGEDHFLFLGWCTPSLEEHPGLELVFRSIYKGSDSNVSPFVIGILHCTMG
jgi:hypothetical protein